jgi:hypothetical protein
MEAKDFAEMLLAAFSGGIASYAAIKSDISNLLARMTLVESSSKAAHDRVDSMLMDIRHKGQ